MVDITSVEQAEALISGSKERPLLVFKHSTRCPVSGRAAGEVDAFSRTPEAAGVTLARVLVVEDRPVSLWLAELLQTPHASPQALLVAEGKVAWTASHFGVTADAMASALRGLAGKG